MPLPTQRSYPDSSSDAPTDGESTRLQDLAITGPPCTVTLPADVLRLVFLACLPSTHNPAMYPTAAPLLLTRVSSAWRAIALSTPPLWAALHVSVASPCPVLPERVAAWLTRAGVLPLRISLSCAPGVDPEPLVAALAAHARRWRTLDLALPQCGVASLALYSLTPEDVPLLESLALRTSDRIPYPPVPAPPPPILSAPRLRSLTLPDLAPFLPAPPPLFSTYPSSSAISGTPSSLSTPLANLTHLALTPHTAPTLTYPAALALLRLAPLIHSATLPLCGTGHISYAPPSRGFELPYLEDLSLEYGYVTAGARFWRSRDVTLPVLRSVQCRIAHPLPLGVDLRDLVPPAPTRVRLELGPYDSEAERARDWTAD